MKKVKNNIALLILFAVIFTNTPVMMAEGLRDTVSIPKIIINDFVDAFNDLLYVGNNVIHTDKDGFLMAAGIVGVTGVSMTFDTTLREIALKNQSTGADNVFKITNEFGNGFYGAAFGGAIYLGGLALGDNEVRITGRLIFESLLLSGAVTTILKSGFGRARPYMNTGETDFRFFRTDNSYLALPSGHTTVVYAISSVLAARIDKWWSYAGFFAVASLTGGARIYYDQHWFSDVVLGAAVATVSGFAVVNAEKNKKNGLSNLKLIPQPNGLALIYFF